MDIAYALLPAGQQWGNNGSINYTSEAKYIIDAIMNNDVNKERMDIEIG